MSELPSGTVTFLFTDVEGSSHLWEDHPDVMHGVLARHDEILRGAIESHNGYVVKATGDGFHATFGTARDTLQAAQTEPPPCSDTACSDQNMCTDARRQARPQGHADPALVHLVSAGE